MQPLLFRVSTMSRRSWTFVPEWFATQASTIGITAGTSTPDDVIDRVDAAHFVSCVTGPDGAQRGDRSQ